MVRVLVVDDEPDYREEIAFCLSDDGHDVRTAGSGPEAVERGLEYRPQVLVADWMLKGHMHGLHVAEVLRTVDPQLRAILITGFPSDDLRSEARRLRVMEFIEKPFLPERLAQAVRLAAQGEPDPGPEHVAVAVLEADGDGRISYMNGQAEKTCGRRPSCMEEVFDAEGLADLPSAMGAWVGVHPRSSPGSSWHVRARPVGDERRRLFVVVPEERKHQCGHPLVKMLLGVAERGPVVWPRKGRALIVDEFDLVRRVVVASLARFGCTCYSAGTCEAGLRLWERDRDVDVVIVDYESAGGGLASFLRRLRTDRPGITIVGTSASPMREAFQAAGVALYVDKPYMVPDVVDLLASAGEEEAR